MRMERCIRKSLGLKAHPVVKVEELPDGGLVAHGDRLPIRHLGWGVCGQATGRVATTRRSERRWRHLGCRDTPVWLASAPHRVHCPTGGRRVERIPWAEAWQRVPRALGRAVATLARALPWAAVAAHFRLTWKTVVHLAFLARRRAESQEGRQSSAGASRRDEGHLSRTR